MRCNCFCISRKNPESPYIFHHFRGKDPYNLKKRYWDAAMEFGHYVSGEPDDPDGTLYLKFGIACLRLGRIEDARRHLRKARMDRRRPRRDREQTPKPLSDTITNIPCVCGEWVLYSPHRKRRIICVISTNSKHGPSSSGTRKGSQRSLGSPVTGRED